MINNHEKNEPYDLFGGQEFLHQGYEPSLLQMAVLVNIDDSNAMEIFAPGGFVDVQG